jgi:hypothetical protein
VHFWAKKVNSGKIFENFQRVKFSENMVHHGLESLQEIKMNKEGIFHLTGALRALGSTGTLIFTILEKIVLISEMAPGICGTGNRLI